MASLGTRTPSKIKFPVDEPRIPSLSSFAPKENPGLSVGTMKALMALEPGNERSVVANTTAQSASWALVIQALVPLSTHSLPSLVAVVAAAPASLPLPGSLKPKHPSL